MRIFRFFQLLFFTLKPNHLIGDLAGQFPNRQSLIKHCWILAKNKRKDMKNDILEVIATHSPFGIDEVHRVFDIFKSYDLLVKACEFAQKTGYLNLETACMLVKSEN